MSRRFLLCTTSLKGARRLGVGNVDAHDLYDRFPSAMGEDKARFLAEPESFGGEIVWYAEGGPTASPRRLSQLSEDERQALFAKAEAKVGELEALSAELKSGRSGEDAYFGDVLSLVVQALPDTSSGEPILYEIDGEPVLVGWGMSPVEDQGDAKPLRAYLREKAFAPKVAPAGPQAPPPPPPQEPAPVAVVERAAWNPLPLALWLLFLALIIWLYWLLLTGCGLSIGPGPLTNHCPDPNRRAAVSSELVEEQARRHALEAKIAAARRQLDAAPICKAPGGSSKGASLAPSGNLRTRLAALTPKRDALAARLARQAGR